MYVHICIHTEYVIMYEHTVTNQLAGLFSASPDKYEGEAIKRTSNTLMNYCYPIFAHAHVLH